MKRTVKLGVVGVDSGQLIICDPCYIDSQWDQEEFEDIRRYQHKATGKVLQYRVDFPHYMKVIPEFGKNMNEMIEKGEVEELPKPPARLEFSYNACCRKTDTIEDGQLYYRLGHPGVAVAFRSGLGDGEYPVFAEIEDVEGFGERITKVWVELI